MNIAELTKSLQSYIEKSQKDLEEILEEPVKEYLKATLAEPSWFAAIMHTSGSEADEAIRMTRVLEKETPEKLAKMVTRKLAGGIISTTLVPAVLPTPLITSTNQALLSCLRDSIEGE